MKYYPTPKTDKNRREGIWSLSDEDLAILRGEKGEPVKRQKNKKHINPKWKDLDMRTVDEVYRDFWAKRGGKP